MPSLIICVHGRLQILDDGCDDECFEGGENEHQGKDSDGKTADDGGARGVAGGVYKRVDRGGEGAGERGIMEGPAERYAMQRDHTMNGHKLMLALGNPAEAMGFPLSRTSGDHCPSFPTHAGFPALRGFGWGF